MRVLVIGGGGREHALCWRIARSPQVEEVHCAPGNPGIAQVARCVDLAEDDVPAWASRNGIGLVVIGPEAPLVRGLADRVRAEGIRAFGPSAAAARLEGSKVFAKQFLDDHGIPTAPFEVASSMAEAEAAIRRFAPDVVVKADGLAGGKGAIVCSDAEEAMDAARQMLVDRRFGEAGARLVVERRLRGVELSVIAVTDGTNHRIMMPAQDHKQVHDNDEGPNTGGMGAYAPAHKLAPPEVIVRAEKEVLIPTIEAMRDAGHPVQGVLYAGLMLDEDGAPHVLEFNVRFGDPETQPQLFMFNSDLAGLMLESDGGDVSTAPVRWNDGVAVTVVLAAEGYPGSPRKGDPIEGLEGLDHGDDRIVFHAGTSTDADRVVVSGGRVLGVTAREADLEQARMTAYEMVDRIRFPGMHYRKDIGVKGL